MTRGKLQRVMPNGEPGWGKRQSKNLRIGTQ